MSEMAYFSKERRVSLKLEIPNSLYVNFDRIRIEQVFMNLLSNAIKNTPPKGTITVKMEIIDSWATFL